MKFKLKKYIYFLNDATNILLKKSRKEDAEKAEKLRLALIIVSVILVLSLILNIFFLLITSY